MIWIENVRPIKERKHWRFIHVKSLDKAEMINTMLFKAGLIAGDIDYPLDFDGKYYIIHHCSVIDSKFNEWIDKLDLIKVRQNYNHYHYILKEES